MSDPIETPAGGAGGGTDTPAEQPASATVRGTSSGMPITPAAAAKPAAAPPVTTTRSERAAAGISNETMSARLARERAAADRKWAESLGCKTVDEAKALVERARAHDQAENERKLAELSEVDRYKKLLDDSAAELARINGEKEQAQERVLIERQERITRETAAKFVKPRALNYACFEFKTHLKTLTDEEVERLKPRDLEKFFANFVKENPEHDASATTTTTTTPPAAAPPGRPAPVRKPITNGGPPVRRDNARPAPVNQPGTSGGKTVRPGQKNSMSPNEVRAYAASHGIAYPGMGTAPTRK